MVEFQRTVRRRGAAMDVLGRVQSGREQRLQAVYYLMDVDTPAAPFPNGTQPAHMPEPPEMLFCEIAHICCNLRISDALGVIGVKAVSVATKVGLFPLITCVVVPHATIPGAAIAAVLEAEFPQLAEPAGGTVAYSFITDVGGVPAKRGLASRLAFTKNETNPSGVTGHEQQDSSSSPGSSV